MKRGVDQEKREGIMSRNIRERCRCDIRWGVPEEPAYSEPLGGDEEREVRGEGSGEGSV